MNARKASPKRQPKLRLHKASGQGFVEIQGRRHYLGRYDLPETRERYHRFMAEVAAGRGAPVERPSDLTVAELAARFMLHAVDYYRGPDGTPTHEVASFRMSLRPLLTLYGSALAADFGPRALKTVREAMIAAGLCRKSINQQIGRIRRMFKWAVSEQLIPAGVLHGLQAVDGLRLGRTDAPESEGVGPVADAHVDAVLPYLPPPVAAMVELQRLTGMRPGEVVVMRGCDLDTTGKTWAYTVPAHKNAWRGHARVVDLGPKARAVIEPFLRTDTEGYLFPPRASVEAKAAAAETHRRPGQAPTPRKTDRALGDHYTNDTYRRCVERACRKAKVPTWTPGRLRHSFATRMRREYGLEIARALCGHRSVQVTAEWYAEVDRAKVAAIVAQVG